MEEANESVGAVVVVDSLRQAASPPLVGRPTNGEICLIVVVS